MLDLRMEQIRLLQQVYSPLKRSRKQQQMEIGCQLRSRWRNFSPHSKFNYFGFVPGIIPDLVFLFTFCHTFHDSCPSLFKKSLNTTATKHSFKISCLSLVLIFTICLLWLLSCVHSSLNFFYLVYYLGLFEFLMLLSTSALLYIILLVVSILNGYLSFDLNLYLLPATPCPVCLSMLSNSKISFLCESVIFQYPTACCTLQQ